MEGLKNMYKTFADMAPTWFVAYNKEHKTKLKPAAAPTKRAREVKCTLTFRTIEGENETTGYTNVLLPVSFDIAPTAIIAKKRHNRVTQYHYRSDLTIPASLAYYLLAKAASEPRARA